MKPLGWISHSASDGMESVPPAYGIEVAGTSLVFMPPRAYHFYLLNAIESLANDNFELSNYGFLE